MDYNYSSAILAQPIRPVVTNDAETALELIKNQVTLFQDSLDSEHDVGLMLTNLGTSVLMEVRSVSISGTHFIVFHGFVNGNYSTLIQHISQLNFLLTSIPKPVEKPRNVIGFKVD